MTALAPSPGYLEYAAAVDDLRADYAAIPPGTPVRLAKRTSNLFRGRTPTATPGLDVSAFSGVLDVDAGSRTADVLGMTTYEDLVAATLPHGLVPLCVPQLRTITLGGAVTGLGIESASWRNGCPHESVLDLDVLTGDGRVVTASATNEHADLFHGFPNSYGSLGYALRLRIELEPVTPYVRLRHVPCGDARGLAATIAEVTSTGAYDGERVDYVDGTVFSRSESYLTLATYAETAEQPPSDYTGEAIYYRSIQQRRSDVLTDARLPLALGHRLVLVLARLRRPEPARAAPVAEGPAALGRVLEARRARPAHVVLLPARRAASPAAARAGGAGHRGPGRRTAGVPRLLPPRGRASSRCGSARCASATPPPVGRSTSSTRARPTSTSASGRRSRCPHDVDPADGRVNRRIEQVVTDLDGRKSLYSTAFYDRDEFARLYGGTTYDRLRATYDPDSRLPDMWTKTVGRG